MKLSQLGGATASEILEALGADSSKLSMAENIATRGLPSKKSEEYRYADIESALDMELEPYLAVASDIHRSDQIIITDGILTHLPDGVEVDYAQDVAVDSEHFDTLYDLGHMAGKYPLTITLDEEIEDMDLQIVHRITRSDSLIAYRIALEVAPNTHHNIYETFESSNAHGTLVLYGYDTFISRDASVNMVKSQTANSNSYKMVASHRFVLDTNSRLDVATFDFGSASGLQTMKIELGERAHVEASHLLYACESAKRGTVSKIIHKGEGSTSNQQAKNILGDRARGIFDALIKVEHSAKYTKAHQNSKAILLETGAYMASKPQLEIYIDELEASHGSTTGQLDGKQLFYLQSRGIAEQEARKMLIQAFANELIDTVGTQQIQEELHQAFDEAFYGQSRVECIETCHGCDPV